jgi:hypothetical protein
MMSLSMQEENYMVEPSLRIRIQDDWFLVLIGLSFFLVFNPLYLLLFFVLLERWIRIPILINYFFVFSFSLMFINRDIGNSWTAGDAYANDDVLNYLEFYAHIFDLNFFKGMGLTLYSGGEPLWFLLAGLVHFITNGNAFSVIVVSVAIPIIILHKVFSSISRDFCFNAAFFIVFFPEINHVLYHLWRYSLSLVLVLFVFIYFLNSRRVNIKFFAMSFLAHISSSFSLSLILFLKLFKSPLVPSISKKLFFVLVLLNFFFIFTYSIYFMLEYVKYEKFIFYLKSEEISTMFSYNARHFFYVLISGIILFFSRRRVSIMISLLGIIVLILPAFYSVRLVYDRILLLLVPVIIIVFLFEIKDYPKVKNVLLLPLFLVAIYLWSKSEGELFYAYMSNGHNFNVFNGIVYNFSDLLMK